MLKKLYRHLPKHEWTDFGMTTVDGLFRRFVVLACKTTKKKTMTACDRRRITNDTNALRRWSEFGMSPAVYESVGPLDDAGVGTASSSGWYTRTDIILWSLVAGRIVQVSAAAVLRWYYISSGAGGGGIWVVRQWKWQRRVVSAPREAHCAISPKILRNVS